MNARLPRPPALSLLFVLALFAVIGAAGPEAVRAAVNQGDVLFCDLNGTLGLAVYSPSNVTTQTVSNGNLIPTPTGVAVESPTSALVTNIGTGRVVRIDVNTGAQTLISQGGLLDQNPDGITMGLNSLAYVTVLQGARIVEIDLATGLQRLVSDGGLLNSAIFLAPLSPNLLVATGQEGVIEVNISTGAQRQIASGGFLVSPQGVAVLPDGHLLVADYGSGRLVRIDPANGAQLVVASGIVNAWGVALDGLGSAYVTRYADGIASLLRVNLTTGAKTNLTTARATPFGVQVFLPSTDPLPPPPAPPAGFVASDNSPIGVTLRWGPVPDAEAYRIYRANQPITVLAPGETSYVDVPEVGTYQYCVTAFNRGGESPLACDSGTRPDYLAEPRIQAARDVPGDQGGKLALAWLASERDNSANRTITGYRVWRRLPLATAKATSPALASRSDVRPRLVAGMIEYWEPILTLPAAFREGYGAVVETTQDSLPESNPYTAFFVSALTADPFVFHDSAVDSGYSVDNLAPPVPPSLSGAYLSTGAVRLSWRTSVAADLREYEVYRGPARELDLVHDEFLGATSDTAFTDPNGGVYYYKVLASDVHGNRSRPATLSPFDIPTPAFVLVASADWRDGALTIAVQLVRDYGWNTATVFRSTTPEIENAVVVEEALLPAGPGLFRYVDPDLPATGALWYWMRIADGQGRFALAGPIVAEPAAGLATTLVALPSPNPARSGMTMNFVVGTDLGSPAGVPVRVKVVNAAGRLVRDLELGFLAPGAHQVAWDRRDRRGALAGAGVYRLTMSIGDRTFGRSVVVVP